MAKSIPGQLSMFDLPIWQASLSATSTPGSVAGATPSALPGGPTTDLCGLAHAPANRSRSQARELVQTMPATSGPTSTASSPPADPLSSWESKLRGRLGTDGSMEFALIWKQLATPGGRSIFRLSRSTPRTFASDSTGSQWTWPTPDTCAGETGPSQANRNSPRLQDLVPLLSPWWTPKASQTMGRYSRVNGKIYPGLWMQAEGSVATWPTPRSSSAMAEDAETILARGGEYKSRLEQVTATWPTPTKADGDGGHGMGTASVTGKREDGSKITVSLPGVVKIVSTWPTPTSQDCARGVGTIRPQDTGIPLPQRVAQVIGTTTSGSPDQTGNRGALNPAFPCWLMGYPTEWENCAPTATPSSRRSRQK